MNKTHRFRSIDDFLDQLPAHEQDIVAILRKLIMECIPDAKEKLAYNVPYYYLHSRICFIWPGSVPWGRRIREGVLLGFCKGYLLEDSAYLEAGERKEVFTKTFYSKKDISVDAVRSLIYEALLIDQRNHRKKV